MSHLLVLLLMQRLPIPRPILHVPMVASAWRPRRIYDYECSLQLCAGSGGKKRVVIPVVGIRGKGLASEDLVRLHGSRQALIPHNPTGHLLSTALHAKVQQSQRRSDGIRRATLGDTPPIWQLGLY